MPRRRSPKPLPLLFLVVLLVAGCSPVEGPASTPTPGAGASGAELGTIVIRVEAEPAGHSGAFTFTGVPTGTVTVDTTLVVTDLEPGTYTTTEGDPAPDFDVTAVACDDGDGTEGLASAGDPQTRTAVINLDPGETVACVFTNTQRATAVVVAETEPQGAAGRFLFTGVPTGTVPAGGTLVVAELPPGTYTTTEADPAPQFDLASVVCDDETSATVSGGDPATRSAVFNLDPGEMVTCTFVNARRGTAVVAFELDAQNATEAVSYTGVPSGTIPPGGTLVVTDLPPGTYTTTEVEPPESYDLVEVTCDDGAGTGLPSSGDPTTRSAIYNIDAGETVTCVFVHEYVPQPVDGEQSTGTGGDTDTGEASDAPDNGGANPFDDPASDLSDFPLPEELPRDAGSATVPRPGTWTAYNLQGQMDCGAMGLGIPASSPENGVMEVLDGGRTIVGTGLQEDAASVTMTADPAIAGRYSGTYEGAQEGVPITIETYWQVVTSEHVVGYLTSSFTAEGVTCRLYRPYELRYAGAE